MKIFWKLKLINCLTNSFFSLTLFLFLFSCVPAQPGKVSSGGCKSYEVFDPTTRSCRDVSESSPPTNSLKVVKMVEDIPLNVILTYEDRSNDYAISCSVTDTSVGISTFGACLCTGGFCTIYIVPDSNFNGISEFTYTVTDDDGTSTPSLVRVEVEAKDDPPLCTTITPNPASFLQETSQAFLLGYSDAESDKAVLCEVDLSFDDYATISYPCTCDRNGSCLFTLTGKEYQTVANSTFTYRVKSETGLWCENQVVGVYSILDAADYPEVISTELQAVVTEPIDPAGGTNLVPWSANMTITYEEGDDETPSACQLVPSSNVGVDFISCVCHAPVATIGTCDVQLDMAVNYHHDNNATNTFSYQLELQDLGTGTWTQSDLIIVSVSAGNDAPAVTDGTLVTGSPHITIKNEDVTIDTAIGFKVDEGGKGDEDVQSIFIKATSADTSIVKTENIAIYWNGVRASESSGGWLDLGDGTLDSNLYPITFIITPELDETTAPMNILVEIKDSAGAVGPSVTFQIQIDNAKDAPLLHKKTKTFQFYNKYQDAPNCDEISTPGIKEDCTRAMSPQFGFANITPNKKGQIFFDHFAGVYYVSTDTVDSTNWTHFITDCPFSTSLAEPSCLRYVSATDQFLNCIGDSAPTFTPEVAGSYYFDYDSDKCYKSSIDNSGDTIWSVTNLYSETTYCNSNSSGTTAPTTTITESMKQDVYENSSESSCYYAKWVDGNPGSGSWTKFTSYCNYTKRDSTQKKGCRYYNCLQESGAPSDNDISGPEMDGDLYRDSSTGQCYRASWDAISETGSWTSYSGSCTGDSGQCRYYNCVGDGAPRKNSLDVKNFIPSAVGDYYYDATNNICYVSYGTERGEWAIYGERLSDLIGNESQPIIMSKLHIDEGNGLAEDPDNITISFDFLTNDKASTDPDKGIGNELLFSPSQVEAFCNGVSIPYNLVTSTSVEFLLEGVDGSCDLSNNSSFKNFEFRFHPIAGDQGHGRSEIKMSISDDNTATTTDRYFSLKVYPIGANHQGWSHLESVGNKKDIFGVLLENGYVKLEWEDFTLSTDMNDTHIPPLEHGVTDYKSSVSISGYNIYRRMNDETYYNFDYPINKTPISTNVRSFTDKVGNSSTIVGPALMRSSGTIYHYTVRAIDSRNGKLINPLDPSISEIRLIAPPDNTVFIHRSMANKRMCEDMGKTPDAENNYRCEYEGMGEVVGTTLTDQTYYDVSTDYLIDRYEAGCPFSYDSTFDLYMGTASNLSLIPAGFDGEDKIYYSRRSGKCYEYSSGSWDELENRNIGVDINLSNADKTRSANLPPLTHLSQVNANNICQLRNPQTIYTGKSLTTNSGSARLPSRKEQIFYSLWPKKLNGTTLTDTTLAGYEQGLTLSSTKLCNSTSANGLSGFSNEAIPNSGEYYSVPGTLDSNIRSLATGSTYTSKCLSLFALQDVIGNVKEWVSDRIYCPEPFYCQGVYEDHPLSTQMNGDFKGMPCRYTLEEEIAPLNLSTNNCGTDLNDDSNNHGHCIGGDSPLAAGLNVTPAINGLIFFDASNDNCYVSAGTTVNDWNQISQYCPITSSELETSCSAYSDAGLYCVGTIVPNIAAVRANSFYYRYDAGNEQCYKSNSDGTWSPYNYNPALTKPVALNSNSDMRTVDYSFHYYELNGRQGPCSSSSGNCEDEISSWEFDEKLYGASYINYPLGLPIVSSFSSSFSERTIIDNLLRIGTGSGAINPRDDLFSVNSESIYQNDPNQCGAMATGGSYQSGTKSGRYTSEFFPCSSSNSTHTSVDIGFRCVIPIPESFY